MNKYGFDYRLYLAGPYLMKFGLWGQTDRIAKSGRTGQLFSRNYFIDQILVEKVFSAVRNLMLPMISSRAPSWWDR